jgi:hypothetical protein
MNLTTTLAAIVDEARAHVAAGRGANAEVLEARIRDAAKRARALEEPNAVARAERRALQQLERVVAVHRARSRLLTEPEPPPRPGPRPRRPLLKERPTISGNLDVRRDGDGRLVWDAVAGVASWEVRVSERSGARGDYVARETTTLPADASSVEVPLGEHALRISLTGRGRDGRPVRRALISALSRANWADRWERRATAS